MGTRFLLFVSVLVVAILACSSLNPLDQSGQPAAPSATPFISESYPTAEAALVSPNQVISGIEVSVEHAWLEGKQVYADVCYTLPDSSDWTIWKAGLRYGEVDVQEYGATLISLQEPGAEGQAGQRCDRLEFYVPPDAEISTVTIRVESIGSYPREDEYCTIYMPKIQQSLNERGVAITLECVDSGGGPIMQISSKPEAMSQEEAEQLVYSDEFFTVKGPWEFTFDLLQ